MPKIVNPDLVDKIKTELQKGRKQKNIAKSLNIGVKLVNRVSTGVYDNYESKIEYFNHKNFK